MVPRRLYVVNLLMLLLPPTRCWSFKRALLRWAGARVGDNVRIVSSARVHMSGALSIGSDTFIGHDVMIVGGAAPIHIGARVDIAPRVLLVTGSHQVGVNEGRAAGEGVSYPISIGEGSWIGASTTVLGGADIGALSIVGAGSLVRGAFPERVLLAGVPARVVREFKEVDSAQQPGT